MEGSELHRVGGEDKGNFVDRLTFKTGKEMSRGGAEELIGSEADLASTYQLRSPAPLYKLIASQIGLVIQPQNWPGVALVASPTISSVLDDFSSSAVILIGGQEVDQLLVVTQAPHCRLVFSILVKSIVAARNSGEIVREAGLADVLVISGVNGSHGASVDCVLPAQALSSDDWLQGPPADLEMRLVESFVFRTARKTALPG